MTAFIKTHDCPRCPLCKSIGEILYSDLEDRIYGANGTWQLRKCSNSRCGSAWLDPMPEEEDIGKAYLKYYTHHESEPGVGVRMRTIKPARALLEKVKTAYWGDTYGYYGRTRSPWRRMVCRVIDCFPQRKYHLDLQVLYLPRMDNGVLLDIGCGDGGRIAFMRELGWRTKGVDFDSAAVQRAREKGLEVLQGQLKDQGFSGQMFDALSLIHVIEHVYDPIEFLKECSRITKPKGRIVLVTPNIESLGSKFFKRAWRGLEPPRHLTIMTRNSLKSIVIAAGFRILQAKTVNATHILAASYAVKRSRNRGAFSSRIGMDLFRVALLTMFESLLQMVNHDLGEQIVVIGEKV